MDSPPLKGGDEGEGGAPIACFTPTLALPHRGGGDFRFAHSDFIQKLRVVKTVYQFDKVTGVLLSCA